MSFVPYSFVEAEVFFTGHCEPEHGRANFTFKRLEDVSFVLPTSPDLSRGPPSFNNGKWRTTAVSGLCFSKNFRTFAKASVALVVPSASKLPCLVEVPVSIVVSVRSRTLDARPAEPPPLPEPDEEAITLALYRQHAAYDSKFQFANPPAVPVHDVWRTSQRGAWKSETLWQPRSATDNRKGSAGYFERIVVWSLTFEPDVVPSYDGLAGRLKVR